MNANRIANLDPFIVMLRGSCPCLEWLSMLNNMACPYFSTRSEYNEYRLQVIATIQTLKVLDTDRITAAERLKAELREVRQGSRLKSCLRFFFISLKGPFKNAQGTNDGR